MAILRPLLVPTHSNLFWSIESDLREDVIREIAHLMLSNRNGDAFTPICFEPACTIDKLALDAAHLADEGFSDITIQRYAWQHEHPRKAVVIMSLVRGTLIAAGALISKEEGTKEHDAPNIIIPD